MTRQGTFSTEGYIILKGLRDCANDPHVGFLDVDGVVRLTVLQDRETGFIARRVGGGKGRFRSGQS